MYVILSFVYYQYPDSQTTCGQVGFSQLVFDDLVVFVLDLLQTSPPAATLRMSQVLTFDRLVSNRTRVAGAS